MNINAESLGKLRTGLVRFPPRLPRTLDELNSSWRACGLHDILGERHWSHVVDVEPGEAIPQAFDRLMYCSPHRPRHNLSRGAILIPNGRYELPKELVLVPFIDLIGESREDTVLTYGGLDNASTIWTKGANCLIAHLTVERTGQFSEPTGYGVRYAIHDNTPGDVPREVLLVDLDCKTTEAVGSNGIGTGFCNGGLHLYCNVNADFGFFCHNGDDVRAEWENKIPRLPERSPGTMIYLNCTAGMNPPVGMPGSALRYWNLGSGQMDKLVVCDGKFLGQQHGLQVIDFGLPFHGESETEVLLGGTSFSGRKMPISVPKDTIVRRL